MGIVLGTAMRKKCMGDAGIEPSNKKRHQPSLYPEDKHEDSQKRENSSEDRDCLHEAAAKGNLSQVTSMVNEIDINKRNQDKRTPLHLACARGHTDVVQYLLRNEADVDVFDIDGQTPLMKAVQCQNEGCIVTLLKHKANLHLADVNGKTALHFATLISEIHLVNLLIENGANINAATKKGETPLNLAIKRDDEKIAEFLLKKGADVNSQDKGKRTPLMHAACNGHYLLVDLLLKYNADTELTDNRNLTADDYAVSHGHNNCSARIIEYKIKKMPQPLGSNWLFKHHGSGTQESKDDDTLETISRISDQHEGDTSWRSLDTNEVDFDLKFFPKRLRKKLAAPLKKMAQTKCQLKDTTSNLRKAMQEKIYMKMGCKCLNEKLKKVQACRLKSQHRIKEMETILEENERIFKDKLEEASLIELKLKYLEEFIQELENKYIQSHQQIEEMEKVIIEKDKAHTQKNEEVISAETKISHLKTSIERLESENCVLKVCVEKQAKEITALQNASQHENVTELELRLYKVLYVEEMDRCKALEEKLKGYSERLAESYKVLLTKSQQIRLTSPKNEKRSPVTYAFSDLPSLLLNLDGTQASQTNKDISETSTLLPANDSLSVNNLIDWHNKQYFVIQFQELQDQHFMSLKRIDELENTLANKNKDVITCSQKIDEVLAEVTERTTQFCQKELMGRLERENYRLKQEAEENRMKMEELEKELQLIKSMELKKYKDLYSEEVERSKLLEDKLNG
ncbi:POTE ankyrin domain family member D-like [Erpetoichthys calabaricus]|uniref:POTE ankyrin domain family member D-like n=1 Tax=Erpetoichthys calabaricus TaxID=27687 RepID=UPI0022346EAD|nr:POTE ankyrin domain family member D-like [Erpetoichthys calabaricus]